MKLLPIILLLVAVVSSCSKKEKQQDILPEKKMRAVMQDLARADQYVAEYLLKDTSRRKKTESIKLYEQVFHLHKITKEQFKKSFDYYTSQPDLFQPIIDSLAVRKLEYTAPAPKPAVKDSVPPPASKPRKHFLKKKKLQVP